MKRWKKIPTDGFCIFEALKGWLRIPFDIFLGLIAAPEPHLILLEMLTFSKIFKMKSRNKEFVHWLLRFLRKFLYFSL